MSRVEVHNVTIVNIISCEVYTLGEACRGTSKSNKENLLLKIIKTKDIALIVERRKSKIGDSVSVVLFNY